MFDGDSDLRRRLRESLRQRDEAAAALAAARAAQESYITDIARAMIAPVLDELRAQRETLDQRMRSLEESLQQLEGRVSALEQEAGMHGAAIGDLRNERLPVNPETLLGLIQGQAEIKSWLAMLSQRLETELAELRRTM